MKQAGKGSSRCHIEVSEIAEGLQRSVKYSLLHYPDEEEIFRFFSKLFLKSPLSRIVSKNGKGGLWGFLNIRSFAN